MRTTSHPRLAPAAPRRHDAVREIEPPCSDEALRVAAQTPLLHSLVATIAARHGVPRRPLELQALMHLPRLATAAGTVDIGVAAGEINTLAATVPRRPRWRGPLLDAGSEVLHVRDLHFAEVDEPVARLVCERFHYLRSHRLGSRYYGLFVEKGDAVPLALAAVSRLDVSGLRVLLPETIDPDAARVLSRVFAFDSAPRNTLSRMLGKVAKAEHRRGTAALVTYVNPNLGFTGVSYQASGWSLLGEQPGTTYRYLDGRYVTDRELARGFGTTDDDELKTRLGDRYGRARMRLAPLLVFGST